MYAPLRVADVRDGMDWLGYHFYGSLDPSIRPLWRTRACGVDVGLMGSDNTLSCLAKGARGIITNGGGIRDSDECILQKVPIWCRFVSQKMDQARIRFSEKNVPVALGGVAIYPGDVIVADGDGVIAVPRKAAAEVAMYASRELRNDKANRRAKYEALGWKPDETM